MDDSEFDFDQLNLLLSFLSSPPPSPPPPPPPPLMMINTLQEQDSSISSQTQSSSDLDSHQKNKPIIITTTSTIIEDDQVQDPPKEKEVIVQKKKKVIRRDVERQRRRDMAKLYQRLRLLIPSKYLMGKRSISDHLDEIVDYVKDLRKDIEDLERKRESLKEKKNIASSSSSMKLRDDEDKIIVKSCNEGVEISIGGGLSLSKVLKVLMKEGLIVNSCVSSTVNQRLIHIIQSKVDTRGNIDLAMLRSKLMSLS